MEPRGIRNSNPGNIRRSKDNWEGLRPVQTDKEFFQFESMAWGYRAMLKTLINYRKLHDCWTVAEFIRRWAPPTENDTGKYIRTVCERMGVPSLYVPDIESKVAMCMLAASMSYVENGVVANMEDVAEGWELL